MLKKKLCMLGSFGVGKTSLIRKYVHNVYSDRYVSTVGVKVDKKAVTLPNGEEVVLLIWDLEGRDDFESVAGTYLRGMSGYFLVADGTRLETLQSVAATGERMRSMFPGASSALLLNKSDLSSEWKVSEFSMSIFEAAGVRTFLTSAALGTGVEEAFLFLAGEMADRG